MTRSLPEKTFEHHLNYRYRSHLQMWWPTSGADIDAARIPGAYGKRIWLELKTVEWNPKQLRHDLSIDLRQLDAYGAGIVPDYYVFPIPKWQGVLGDTTSLSWLGALPGPLLAYQTRSKQKWFADWTFVVPGHVLRSCLAPQITAFRKTGKGNALRIAEVAMSRLNWVLPGLAGVDPISWKGFWTVMEKCGSTYYPAQFVLPNGRVSDSAPKPGTPDGSSSAGPTVSRSSLVAQLGLLAEESKSGETVRPQSVTLYTRVSEDNYEISPLDGRGIADGFVWDSARALILVEPGGLGLSPG